MKNEDNSIILGRDMVIKYPTLTEILMQNVGKEFTEGGVTYKVVIVDDERGTHEQ